MKKKRVFLIVLAWLLIVAIGAGIFIVVKYQKNKEEAQMQRELEYKYYLQSSVFGLEIASIDGARYAPYSDRFVYQVYIDLAYYQKTTGKELTIPEIQEYLSQEFEEDGSVRIYDNDSHPKIQEYIEWRTERGRDKEIREYTDHLLDVFAEYKKINYFDKGLKNPFPNFVNLSFEQYDELIKKEADPSYEMQFGFE